MKNKNRTKKEISFIGIILFLLSLAGIGYLLYVVFSNSLLDINYRLILLGLSVVFEIFVGWYLIYKRKNKALKILLSVLVLIVSATAAGASNYVDQSMKSLDIISGKQETYQFSLVVPIDSKIESISDIENKEVLSALKIDEANVNTFKTKMIYKENKSLNYVDGGDYFSMSKKVSEKEADVILLNESYRSAIVDQIPDFEKKTKVIYSTDFKGKNKLAHKEIKKNQPFNVYISGIDTFGKISNVSRSDVNLLVTVNPKNNKILITTVPRDTYTKIAGGGNDEYDKFTHSGIYGINSSVKTMENLLDTDVNYYVRVNFSTLIKIVDVLGGVDVDNKQAFSVGSYYFDAGKIHLNGKEALVYARDRYHQENGDMDRGRNHEKILAAIIDKATKANSMADYQEMLNVATESSETNMPKTKIIELINRQINMNKNWDYQMQDLKGQGTMGKPSYAMPGSRLYMFVPYDESIRLIKSEIDKNLQ
ncbi:LCP family protein [Peptostreptococcus equinus]|uniref:LCP family protein n=1 Tax=Peptostreptococcus equinus TaxID=3003601 RepID=A0ABY7JR63_9FIRM|nr:LCP family protein [Peptostreptococcus sp. CBA3647]WAW14167.1 LCP family protein [Peptostreptococcus sp. CBA3647]